MKNLIDAIINKIKKQPTLLIGGFLLILFFLIILGFAEQKKPPDKLRPLLKTDSFEETKRSLLKEQQEKTKVTPLKKEPPVIKEGEEKVLPRLITAKTPPEKIAKGAGNYVISTYAISASGTLVKKTCSRVGEVGDCSIANVSGRIAGVVVEALDELYKLTNDSQYQDKAFEIGEAILKACLKDSEACRWGFYGLDNLYQKTNDAKYLNAMFQARPRLTNIPGINLYVGSENIKKTLMLYMASGDFSYLNSALNDYNNIIYNALNDRNKNPILYTTTAGLPVGKFDCQKVWGTDLAFYKATGEEKYLDQAKSFFQSSNLSENLSKIEELPQLNHCLDALIDLFEITGDNVFKNQAKTLAQFMVENFWDSPDYPRFNGDGAFVIFTTAKEEYRRHNIKCAAETAWMVKNLARLSRLGINFYP